MSIEDHWIDEPERYCECGQPALYGRFCSDCYHDNIDLYADMNIRDKKEGK